MKTEHIKTEHMTTEHMKTEHMKTEHMKTEHMTTEHMKVDGMETDCDKTLLERMGGASAVIDTIEGLHERMVADDDLCPFIEGVDAEVWTGKLYDFLGRMLGASEYDGARLRKAHQRLVDDGLGDAQFDATLDHLRLALAVAEVPADCTEEVIAAFESTRADVLCKPANDQG